MTAEEFDRVVKKLQMTRAADRKKHQVYWFELGGKKVLWTMRSHGRGELGIVENAIRKQLNVSKQQFRDLAQCPMSLADYISHLQGLGLVEKPAD